MNDEPEVTTSDGPTEEASTDAALATGVEPSGLGLGLRATWLTAAILAVVLVAVLVIASAQGPSTAERQTEVRAVAERFARAITTYDYRHLDRDLAAVRALSTGNFRAEYEQVLGGPGFRQALRENRARATSKVTVGPFLASYADDGARTFTVLEQRVVGKDAATPRRQRVRIETVLVRTVKGWRIDRVEIT